jgi:hypothetical protein
MGTRRFLRSVFPRLLAFSIAVAITSAGCGPGLVEGTQTWIDVPEDGLRALPGQPIRIEGHVSNPEGIESVEIRANDVVVANLEPVVGDGSLGRFAFEWTPPGFGEFVLQAVAIGREGALGAPDLARVVVVGIERAVEDATATPPPAVTAPPDVTAPPPDISATPGPIVEFYADPPAISAGACALLVWRVQNAQAVRLGVNPVDSEGMYEVCHCESTSYTLTVVHFDGVEEEHRVPIEVTGTCASPTPPTDGTPPSAPSPSSPGNGASLTCAASVTMSWSAVSDPSGIAQYQVEAQRHSGDGVWHAVSGGPWTGISGTSRSIGVECGWTYRWRVRAVDGAGNTGAWSGWSSFVVVLT